MNAATDVLVIDDSATIRKLVELSMRGSSFRAHFAPSGSDGVDLARARRPDAILLDCVLPDMTGLEVCRLLSTDERTRAIPILLITARSESARDEFRQFTSVVDFVGKPFTGPDLLHRIGRATGVRNGGGIKGFTRDRQERAARILYGRLREGLALVPSYMSQLGASPPAPFFAKRLFTPEVMDGLLDELVDLCGEILAAPRATPGAADANALPPTSLLDRVPGFSDKVGQARLVSTARRMLTLIDGRHTLAQISQRLDLDELTVCAVARDLVVAGLVADRTNASADKARPIVILEPDVHGFQRPLASLLETRPDSHPLVAVDSLDEVLAASHRVRPCLVVVNATSERAGVGDAARRLRADTTLADVALVAVLDVHDRSSVDHLYSAGFDAVLSKPIIFGELERFIAPQAAR
jgi:CheY-like chemotaxis protein